MAQMWNANKFCRILIFLWSKIWCRSYQRSLLSRVATVFQSSIIENDWNQLDFEIFFDFQLKIQWIGMRERYKYIISWFLFKSLFIPIEMFIEFPGKSGHLSFLWNRKAVDVCDCTMLDDEYRISMISIRVAERKKDV